MLVIICERYGKNPFRTVHVVQWTWLNVPYFSSFIANSWLNNLEDIGQGQRSLCTTHPLMLIDHLCQMWQESIQNWACCRADSTRCVLWWAPSAKRKDHHGVSSGWSSVWHCLNTGLSSTQYEQIPIILGVWPFWLTPFFFRSITFWRAYG